LCLRATVFLKCLKSWLDFRFVAVLVGGEFV